MSTLWAGVQAERGCGLLEAKAGQWGTYKIVSVAVLVAVKNVAVDGFFKSFKINRFIARSGRN